MSDAFRTEELISSQIPAIQVLVNLGYEYLTPVQALAARGGRLAQVVLDEVLREQLKKINRISYRDAEHLFSEENISSAMERLKGVRYSGLQHANACAYDLLTLGVSLEQTLDGDTKSFSLRYIDWDEPRNNKFHVVAGYTVERARSHATSRPDLVLFVNGIPFAVIECAAPQVKLAEPIAQMLLHQSDLHIPDLFSYVQLVMAVNMHDMRYATTGTRPRFWTRWQEQVSDSLIAALVTQPLAESIKAALIDLAAEGYDPDLLALQERQPYIKRRAADAQDRALVALCSPERLLELTYHYTVFDGGIRKLARYQQFFGVQRALDRVRLQDGRGRRRGGIIWHAEGSGRSLTMVMLARQLALAADIAAPRIVLVSEQHDLGAQLGNTFLRCAMHPQAARTGRDLLALLAVQKRQVISSRAYKFSRAAARKKYYDDSADIFLLVDENHQSPIGLYAQALWELFPNACYIGFSGTPLTRQERQQADGQAGHQDSIGPLIDVYSTEQALDDAVLLPVFYESRWMGPDAAVPPEQSESESESQPQTQPQPQSLYRTACDINEHFRASYQGSGLKGQLVAPDKRSALQYKEILDQLGVVSSELVINGPDTPEGGDPVGAEADELMRQFWHRMMARYGNEDSYHKSIIQQFMHADTPEIFIVVDKLLNGFDAPRNAVLYLARNLSGHTLLQAIARVNRVADSGTEAGIEQKLFGTVIDYTGALGGLDLPLNAYPALADFDEADLRGAVMSAGQEIARLPGAHAALWELFREVENRQDQSRFEQILIDWAKREEFYRRLAKYTGTLAVALGNEQFLHQTDVGVLAGYKNDLQLFYQLKVALKLRFSEESEVAAPASATKPATKQNTRWPDDFVSLHDLPQYTVPDLFDQAAFHAALAAHGLHSTVAQADAIAYHTRRAIHQRLDQDPAFYRPLARTIQRTIDSYQGHRITDIAYLKQASEIRDALLHRQLDHVPMEIRGDADALAFFGILQPMLDRGASPEQSAARAAHAACAFLTILACHSKVNFWGDSAILADTENALDDFIYEVIQEQWQIVLTAGQKDDLIRSVMHLARNRTINAGA